MLISFICSFMTGRTDETFTAFLNSSKSALDFLLSVGGIMALWSGIMAIAERSGLTERLARLLSPLIRLIFFDVQRGSESERAIAMNMVANFLGLSNAATPLGIKAMKELKGNKNITCATRDMCMLAVLNSASIQLIPSTLIGIRASLESAEPGAIILPIWIVSVITAMVGIACVKLSYKKTRCVNL